jgi:hypothetical protein
VPGAATLPTSWTVQDTSIVELAGAEGGAVAETSFRSGAWSVILTV